MRTKIADPGFAEDVIISVTRIFGLEVFCRELGPTILSNLLIVLDFLSPLPAEHGRVPFSTGL